MTVLEKIIEEKTQEVTKLRSNFDLERAREEVIELPPCRDFLRAFKKTDQNPIIAEIKRRSPSRGELARDVKVWDRAKMYQSSGAAAISVLTDSVHFGGSIADLGECKSAVDIPVLRKDFVIDEAQLFESRMAGADAVLLIAAALGDSQYEMLLKTTVELGMTPLTEVHNREELDRILPHSPPLIGINNRNLHTLQTDINVTKELMKVMPEVIVAIAESGVHTAAQLRELKECGVSGFLIGTALMTASNPAELLEEMCKI